MTMYSRQEGYPPRHHRSQDHPRYNDRYPRESGREGHRGDDYDFDRYDEDDDYRRGGHRDSYQSSRDYARAAYEGHENFGHGYNAGDGDRYDDFNYRGERPWHHDRHFEERQREEDYYYNREPRHDYERRGEYGMHNSERYRSVPERRRRRDDDEPYSDNWSNAFTPMSKY